ncbi:hypothetical protein [Jeotgalibacillus proteolyticus]|uniref:hypothetical protein n=1 Tax=Jeotgalibacillus proteolyticus TaxID=2082395 RepID=UPI003CFA1763
MHELVDIFLLFIILLIVIAILILQSIDFIKTTPIQIQVFGIHLTIFGGLLVLNDSTIIGFLIMLLGLTIGIFGVFKDSGSVNK